MNWIEHNGWIPDFSKLTEATSDRSHISVAYHTWHRRVEIWPVNYIWNQSTVISTTFINLSVRGNNLNGMERRLSHETYQRHQLAIACQHEFSFSRQCQHCAWLCTSETHKHLRNYLYCLFVRLLAGVWGEYVGWVCGVGVWVSVRVCGVSVWVCRCMWAGCLVVWVCGVSVWVCRCMWAGCLVVWVCGVSGWVCGVCGWGVGWCVVWVGGGGGVVYVGGGWGWGRWLDPRPCETWLKAWLIKVLSNQTP